MGGGWTCLAGKKDIFGVNCWAKLDIVGDFCCVCLQHPATVKEDQNSSSDASRSPTGSHSPEKPSKPQRDCLKGTGWNGSESETKQEDGQHFFMLPLKPCFNSIVLC